MFVSAIKTEDGYRLMPIGYDNEDTAMAYRILAKSGLLGEFKTPETARATATVHGLEYVTIH